MNAWAPGRQSTVYPNAPAGLLFPGDPGVPAGIAPVDYKEFMPRLGFAWDPFVEQNDRARRLRPFLRRLHERHGRPAAGRGQRAAVDAGVPVAGSGIQPGQPLWRSPDPVRHRDFVAPATVLTVQSGMRPPYRRTGISRLSRPSPVTICLTFAMSVTRARTCRALSRRIHYLRAGRQSEQ